ncbi:uncharacterized protein HKW66_Vig0146120 [Vigna angularis]|uniref:Uncharacterized protein n=1 Tax=Phaseolus angularis TaxID=3914 RepID=A0A8T0KE26_PHAAN|nr:uncharacterized protein HKW66_Vig0146120 [Vigna angularis]
MLRAKVGAMRLRKTSYLFSKSLQRRTKLRRTKSFSASKIEPFSTSFEPHRKSCDVRFRNTLSDVRVRNTLSAVRIRSPREPDPPSFGDKEQISMEKGCRCQEQISNLLCRETKTTNTPPLSQARRISPSQSTLRVAAAARTRNPHGSHLCRCAAIHWTRDEEP